MRIHVEDFRDFSPTLVSETTSRPSFLQMVLTVSPSGNVPLKVRSSDELVRWIARPLNVSKCGERSTKRRQRRP